MNRLKTPNKIAVCAALVPNDILAERQTKISRELAGRIPSHVVLDASGDTLSTWPHLTLYQAALPWEELANVDEDIAAIAKNEAPHQLEATEYALNPDGAFEVRYNNTPRLRALQNLLISRVNPRRHGLLLDKDPGGNPVAEQALTNEKIARTGFAEIDEDLRTHSTLAWWEMDQNPVIPTELLPEPSHLSGTFAAIGMFAMGDHGKCAQLLGQLHPLQGTEAA